MKKLSKNSLGIVLLVGVLIVGLVYFVMRRNISKNEGFAGPCYSTAWYINELQPGITFEFNSGSGMISPNTLLLANRCMECTTANNTLATLTSLKQQGGDNTIISILDPNNGLSMVKFKLAVWSNDDQDNAIVPIGISGNDVVEGSIPGINSLSEKTFKILFLDSSKCPVDCIYGPWTDVSWSTCPSCGPPGLTRTQNRVFTPPKNGGKCNDWSTSQQVPCGNLPLCPVDCRGYYIDSTTCPSCGPAGTTKRQTFIVTQAQVGTGTACPPSTQTVACNIPTCEDPPPVPSTPAMPYPFRCADTYDIKIVYSPPDANKNVTLHALLLLKPGATDVATKSSTWTVTSAPNFAARTGSPVIGKWTDRITWQFPLAQTYTVQYTLTYGGRTCSFTFPITITGQICSDPCTNLNTTTNSCQAITLPPAPPRTRNGPKCQDVRCGPNQFKDCPVIYQPGNSPTNPCPPGNVYDFNTRTCSPSGEHCCNYSLTTGLLDQGKFATARNDTRCVDNLTQQYRIKGTSPTPCRPKYTPGVDNKCCDPRAATLPACRNYWEAVPGWKKNPVNCQVPPPYQGFKDYDGYETQEIAPVEQDSILFTKGALQTMRQKMINMKTLFN